MPDEMIAGHGELAHRRAFPVAGEDPAQFGWIGLPAPFIAPVALIRRHESTPMIRHTALICRELEGSRALATA
ncbi:hypothetical protein ACFU8Q_13865 [Streptomyces sp. NPDC057543]|uniref:hypothetical protein n=1 Tax=Streptomyces sp. NPDC057543 TaxID=3346163 RepID=UPI003699BCC5